MAIALRNRWRRQQLDPEMAEEVLPKNILMIGPTGVGKTEIARRLARLAQAPFLKVEASKFTEVGYIGRDVESMVRDLMELSITMVRASHSEEVKEKAAQQVEERLLDLLLPPVGAHARTEDDAPSPSSAPPMQTLQSRLVEQYRVASSAQALTLLGGAGRSASSMISNRSSVYPRGSV